MANLSQTRCSATIFKKVKGTQLYISRTCRKGAKYEGMCPMHFRKSK